MPSTACVAFALLSRPDVAYGGRYRLLTALFTAGGGLAQHFSILFHPIASEYDLLGKFPQAAHTIKNVDAYHTALEELRTSISPELELIESRVVGPVRELQGVMKSIRKMITKREHKVSIPSSQSYMRSVHPDLMSLCLAGRLRPIQQLVDKVEGQEREESQR
jgi:hypothetical protein